MKEKYEALVKPENPIIEDLVADFGKYEIRSKGTRTGVEEVYWRKSPKEDWVKLIKGREWEPTYGGFKFIGNFWKA